MLLELSVEIKLSSYLKKEREMCLTRNFLEKQVALLFDRQFAPDFCFTASGNLSASLNFVHKKNYFCKI